MKKSTNDLMKEIQLAFLALEYKISGNSQRDKFVHIDDIRKWVEQRNPYKWRAETVTRSVRKMKDYGMLEKKADGIYALKR